MKDELELDGTEKLSEFPKKFNKLVKRVVSLEIMVKKLTGKKKK